MSEDESELQESQDEACLPGANGTSAEGLEAESGEEGQRSAVESAATKSEEAGRSRPKCESSLFRAIVALQEKAEQKHDRLLRVTADFENYRKRARREQTLAVEQAEQKIVLQFLPILDNLERAIDHARESAADVETTRNLLEGVEMVQKQFLSALAQHGIEPFDAVGTPFDPEYHEALQQVESAAPRNTVVHEIQRGYKRSGKLVRPAMVIVSSGQRAASESEGAASSSEGTGGSADAGASVSEGEVN